MLNEILKKKAPALHAMLSATGRAMYFPHQGILAQSEDARDKKINATIGIGLEEDGVPMALPCISDRIDLPKADVFPYAGSFGIAKLRRAWKKELLKKNPGLRSELMSMPVVTAGITHALSVAGALFIEPGDALIMPDLFWENYRLMFEKARGAALNTFPAFTAGGFNVAGLRDALTTGGAGKKIVLLNFPNNPTGYTPTESEAEGIVAAIQKGAEAGHSIVVLVDDAYFGLVYEKGVLTDSLFSHLSSLHSRVLAIKIDGASKEDFAWGLRVGFVTYGTSGMRPDVARALEEKTAGMVRAEVSNASHLSQSLLLKAMNNPHRARQKKEKFNLLKKRYRAVQKILKAHPEYGTYFQPLPFNSGYFMCVELKGRRDAETVRQKLLKNFNTGVIALGKLIRIAFSAVPTKDLPRLFENIYRACGGLDRN